MEHESTTGVAADELKQFIERIERLNEDKKAVSDDIKDVYNEAKGRGFDKKALRALIRLRAKAANRKNEMTEQERAAALADRIEHRGVVKLDVEDGREDDAELSLIVAALRALADRPAVPTSVALVFEGGSLRIDKDGRGTFCFADEDLEHAPDDDCSKVYRTIRIDASELEFLRDHLSGKPQRPAVSADLREVVAKAISSHRPAGTIATIGEELSAHAIGSITAAVLSAIRAAGYEVVKTAKPALPPIETEGAREYIPLPGGWEIQTKGTGSSYRLCDTKTGERHNILGNDLPTTQNFMTRAAKEIRAAYEGDRLDRAAKGGAE